MTNNPGADEVATRLRSLPIATPALTDAGIVPSEDLPESADVLIIGAGPAGASAAAWAATAGHRVVLVDRSQFPRDKTCGDGITPRSVRELERIGLGPWLEKFPRLSGLRLSTFGKMHDLHWPASKFPDYSTAVKRVELDLAVLGRALSAGATFVAGRRVISIDRDDIDRGDGAGSVTTVNFDNGAQVRCKQLLVADGAGSPVGQMLGRHWDRGVVYATASRQYARSSLGDDDFLTVYLGWEAAGMGAVPGYGWVFPLGNGLVNIGFGAMRVNGNELPASTRALHERFVGSLAETVDIDLDPPSYAAAPLSLGGSVSTIAGKNWMLIGDAAVGTNPLTGEGIDFALESGRMAAARLGEPDHSAQWPALLRHHYAHPLAAERKLVRTMALHPKLARRAMPFAVSKGWRGRMVLQSSANLIEPTDRGLIPALYRSVGRFSARSERPMFD